MMRAFACTVSAAILSSVGFGQPAKAPAAFEIADVHVSAGGATPRTMSGILRGSRYEWLNVSMMDLIKTAYGVDPDTVIGTPNSLESGRFDIIAKVPPLTSLESVNGMLQALLADRFKLVIHKDKKLMQGFELSLGKGKPKISKAEGSSNPGCQPPATPPEPGRVRYNMASCRNLTMRAFAVMLRGLAAAYISGPVLDSSRLEGAWDFDLKWTSRSQLPAAGVDGVSMFDAIEKQLGLKLEARKVLMPIIVVDSVNEKPTENPPGVALIPPPV